MLYKGYTTVGGSPLRGRTLRAYELWPRAELYEFQISDISDHTTPSYGYVYTRGRVGS